MFSLQSLLAAEPREGDSTDDQSRRCSKCDESNQRRHDERAHLNSEMWSLRISTRRLSDDQTRNTVSDSCFLFSSSNRCFRQTTGELLKPSNTLTVNGFIELSSIRSAMAISKHILLPIQRYVRPQPAMPMFATKKSSTTASASAATNSPPILSKKSNSANNFYYLLLISLKKEKSAALISVNDQWFGAIHCQKFERKKKSSRLILSVFEPGDCIPWISSFERLGPYAVVFPPANNADLAYKKQAWPVKQFPRSYTETFLIWCRQNNFQVSVTMITSLLTD